MHLLCLDFIPLRQSLDVLLHRIKLENFLQNFRLKLQIGQIILQGITVPFVLQY